jgi:hypothetical protein
MVNRSLAGALFGFFYSTVQSEVIEPLFDYMASLKPSMPAFLGKIPKFTCGIVFYKVVAIGPDGQQQQSLQLCLHDALCYITERSHEIETARVESVQLINGQFVTLDTTEYRFRACAHIVMGDGYSFDVKMPSGEALQSRIRDIPNKIRCELFAEVETYTPAAC